MKSYILRDIAGEIGPESLKPADAVLQIENADSVGGHRPTEEVITYSLEEEKRLVRKCDWILIPVMACGTAFSYLDKIAIGNAATLSFKQDLNLKGEEYSLLTTVYYVGFIIAQWPANMALQKFNTGWVMSISMFLWGCVTLGSFAVQTFAQMAALRFLLAVFEACIVPGLVLTTVSFYKPTEVPMRTALWTLANTLLPIPFSVIYYGFAKLPSEPLEQWRYIYILLGCLTLLLSLGVFVVIPDQPSTCWWLSKRERQIVVHRTAVSQVARKSQEFKRDQMVEALTDLKAWLLVLPMACQQSGQSAVANFTGQLIVGMGFSGLNALILQILGWVCSCGLILTIGYLGSHTQYFRSRKLLILMISCLLAVAGLAVLVVFPPKSGANQGMQLFFLSLLHAHGGAYSAIMTLVGQNFAGSTKKTFVLSMMFSGFVLSNMLVPLSFRDEEDPVFKTGLTTVMSMLCVCFLTYIRFYVIADRENARRDRVAIEQPGDEDANQAVDSDLTDKQNLRFRYYS